MQSLLTEMTNYLWIRPFPWRGIRARFLRLIGKDPGFAGVSAMAGGGLRPAHELQERWKEWANIPN